MIPAVAHSALTIALLIIDLFIKWRSSYYSLDMLHVLIADEKNKINKYFPYNDNLMKRRRRRKALSYNTIRHYICFYYYFYFSKIFVTMNYYNIHMERKKKEKVEMK